MMNLQPFTYRETHKVAGQAGNRVHRSSEGADWPLLFASVQTEAAWEAYVPAIADHLIVVPLKQPVQCTRRIGGELQEHFLLPGSSTITPGGADFSIRNKSDNDIYETIHLYVRHQLLEQVHGEMFESDASINILPCIGMMDLMLQAIASEICKILAAPDVSERLYVESLSRNLAGYMVRNCTPGHFRQEAKLPGELSPQQFNRAIQYIETCLDSNISLIAIAKAAGVNPTRLARGFKKNTSLTPYEYVVQARVNRAKNLLISTNLSLAEIAVSCGFSHQQHMTRIVHRVAGTTPGAIRRGR